MVELIQDSLEITSKNFNVGEVLLSEQYADTIIKYFKGEGPPKLLFYFQSTEGQNIEEMREMLTEQQFFLTTGETIPLEAKGVYFLRMTDDGIPITMGENDGTILFGEIAPNILNQLNMMMSCVFQPVIERLEKTYWKQCDKEQKKEFLKLNYNFTEELDESINSLSKNIKKCKVDQEHVNGIQNEIDRSKYFEKIFAEWLDYFNDKLKMDS